ncbi:MAG: DUF2851 family protein [Chloroflexi bacterium]|nr:DUF2851 family protein [Chloroflexota bacterium]
MRAMAARSSTYTAVSERLVAQVWQRQLVDKEKLATSDGSPVEVVYPGRSCRDHGPDFRDALVVLAGDLRRGDIEVHVRSSDWRVHRHHLDTAYDGVLLHVVLWQDGAAATLKSDGLEAPVLPLENSLPVPVEFLAAYIEASKEPASCHAAPGDPQAIARMLDEAAEDRLASKAVALEGDLAVYPAGEVLYGAIMDALGYTKNRDAFLELAHIVPLSIVESVAHCTPRLERVKTLQAVLFGAAGLLPSQRQGAACAQAVAPRGTLVGTLHATSLPGQRRPVSQMAGDETTDTPRYVAELETVWERWGALWLDGQMVRTRWHFARVRPCNFPTRRIAAAAELLARHLDYGLPEAFIDLLRRGAPKELSRALLQAIAVSSTHSYWFHRHDFDGLGRFPDGHNATDRRLIGRDRALEIAANAVLPFALAYARHTSDPGLEESAVAIFHALPASGGNEITRHMARLMLDTRDIGLAAPASRQQGLLHIYRTWCLDKWCAECPAPRH